MPFVLSCKQCGQVLFEVKTLKEGSYKLLGCDWYHQVYVANHGHCPGCEHRLPEPWEYGRELSVRVFVKKGGELREVEAGPEW